MRHAGAMLAGLVAALGAAPTLAAPSAYDVDFVSSFADACVAQRTSFVGTKTAAETSGWVVAGPDADPELQAIMGLSAQAAADIRKNNGEIDFATFSKSIDGTPHYLIVSNALIGPKDKRDTIVGCYMYNFAAAAAIDPEAVTALVGEPVSQSQVDMHISSYQWASPKKLPGTLDIYLTFVPEVSQYKDQFGFSGLVLQFNTSVPQTPQS